MEDELKSILKSIKKLLGVPTDLDEFDMDLIIHINSALSTLTQLGIGPSEGFSISDEDAEWSDFLPNETKLGMVKSYVFMKVKLIFDPGTNASVIASYQELIREFEFRANLEAENMRREENQNG